MSSGTLDRVLPVVMPQYCERDVYGAEIVNTLTNVGFWIAAAAIFPMWRRGRSRFIAYAMVLLFVVGLCSGLFHAFRTPLLLVMDAVPLYLLILSMAFRVLSLESRTATAVVFIAGVIGAAMAANALTVGTAVHVASRHGAALIAFAGMAAWARGRNRTAGNWMLAAVACYAVALAAKTVDGAVCRVLPIGSHWVWHLVGSLASYLGLRGVMEVERR